LAAATVIAACGGDDDSDDTAARETTTTRPEVIIAPLRGTEVDDAVVLERPAISTKIDNTENGRPQRGLDLADVVFEELTEGGITRFLAMFQSDLPGEIGPVRSVRAVDPAVVQAVGGIFAYSGGVPQNVDKIENTDGVKAIDETEAADAMRRDSTRPRAPYNLFASPDGLLELAPDDATAPPSLFEYDEAAPAGAAACAQVTLEPSAEPEYDSIYDWIDGEGWRRSTNDGPFTVDGGAGVSPENVVVVWVRDQSPEATTGEGEALVLRDGTATLGRWQRADTASGWQFTDGEGAPVALAPGITWVHMLVEGTGAVTSECPIGT
jgi:hypothetical protein